MELLAEVIHAATDAVQLYLTDGLEPAMNQVNGVVLSQPEDAAE